MNHPVAIHFVETDLDAFGAWEGAVAVLVSTEGKMGQEARRVNRLTKGAVARAVESDAFAKAKSGAVITLGFPAGMAATKVLLLKMDAKVAEGAARKAGAALGKAAGRDKLLLALGANRSGAGLALGLALKSYRFDTHKTPPEDEVAQGEITIMHKTPEDLAQAAGHGAAVAEGVFFTRDLVNEPANVLTTEDFAARLAAMGELGLEVEILEEDQLAELGMRALLGVGQGSESPSKVVVMSWKGGGEEAPLALVGKGVVFDTGGISLKPAGGMEDMTMDMGGAGVVAGVMRTLALRKAKANVVGLVGLVENMPDGRAQRPGDVVTSMKGDTIEVINTDAEGRLVLCDVMWYAQERFKPRGMIDLATLTGAVIIGLGHDNAGVFSNNDDLCGALLKAADAEGEGAWRLPLGPGYDAQLKSRVADMKNVGGRPAGSITAAQFLGRFVQDGMPWCHIDIAGVASIAKGTDLSPPGATGWGVMTLDRLVRDLNDEG